MAALQVFVFSKLADLGLIEQMPSEDDVREKLMRLQQFNSDAEQVDAWITKQEEALTTCEGFGLNLQEVREKQYLLDRYNAEYEMYNGKLQAIRILSQQLPDTIRRLEDITKAWARIGLLRDLCKERTSKGHQLQILYREADETITWMRKVAMDMDVNCEKESATLSEKVSALEIKAQLLKELHPVTAHITCRMTAIESESSLLKVKLQTMSAESMDFQKFVRDTAEAEAGLDKQEAFLANGDLGDSVRSVMDLSFSLNEFEDSLATQEENMTAFHAFCTKLIENKHYAAAAVAAKQDQLLTRSKGVYEAVERRQHELKEAFMWQMFLNDCKDMKSWITGKLKTVKNQTYQGHTSLKRQEELEAAVRAKEKELDGLKKSSLAQHNRDKVDEILELWENLQKQTALKGNKLREAYEMQMLFNHSVKDFETWMSETEKQLISEDYKKDPHSASATLDIAVEAQQPHIQRIEAQAKFLNLSSVQHKVTDIIDRYKALQNSMAARRLCLEKAVRLQRFVREFDDVNEWMDEKKRMTLIRRAHDLDEIEGQLMEYRACQVEIANYQHRIFQVDMMGKEMEEQNHYAVQGIKHMISCIHDRWNALKTNISDRIQHLSDLRKMHKQAKARKNKEIRTIVELRSELKGKEKKLRTLSERLVLLRWQRRSRTCSSTTVGTSTTGTSATVTVEEEEEEVFEQ